MKKRLIGYAAFYLIALAVFVVAGLPASWVVSRAELPPQITLRDVQGTLWTGSAALADQHGPLGRLDWDLDAWPLLTGTVAGHVHLHGPLGEIQGQIAIEGQQLELSETTLALDLYAITSRPPALFPLRGEVIGTIDYALADMSGLKALEGPLSVQQAGATFPMELALGTYMVEFKTEGEVITGTITSSEKPLSASGRVTLQQGSRYQLNLTLRPDASADPALRDMVAMAGRARPDGSVTLVQRGDLRRWLGQ